MRFLLCLLIVLFPASSMAQSPLGLFGPRPNSMMKVRKEQHTKEFEQEKKLIIDRKLALELRTDDIASKAVGDLRMDGFIENRKISFENLEAVSYKDITDFLIELFKGKTLLYEVFLPDEYNTEEIKAKLKSILS